jgi:hypothetical protein
MQMFPVSAGEAAAHDIARTIMRNKRRGDTTRFKKIPLQEISRVWVVTVLEEWDMQTLEKWESENEIS